MEILLPTYLKSQNIHKLSTMVGENYDIYFSQMAKYALKLLTMLGENFDIYLPRMAKYALKFSSMVGDFF